MRRNLIRKNLVSTQAKVLFGVFTSHLILRLFSNYLNILKCKNDFLLAFHRHTKGTRFLSIYQFKCLTWWCCYCCCCFGWCIIYCLFFSVFTTKLTKISQTPRINSRLLNFFHLKLTESTHKFDNFLYK